MNRILRSGGSKVVWVGAVALAFLSDAVQAQPKPEPPPYEVVDWQTVLRECAGTARAITNEKDVECVKRVVARMPKFNPERRELFGKYYDPQKYLKNRLSDPVWSHVGGTHLTLQRIPAPEYLAYPDAKRPNLPPPNLDKHYSRWIKPEDYFKALCKHEAGEVISRTVEGVAGVYQIRPRPKVSDDALTDPYVLEDPYGDTTFENALGLFLGQGNFSFAEAPGAAPYTERRPNAAFLRFTLPDERSSTPQIAEVTQIDARYGYTWREFTGIRERELGISGGDLIVVDLRTGEVLGHKRGFVRSAITDRTLGGRVWRGAAACPAYAGNGGAMVGKDINMTYWFLRKVLKPIEKKGN